MTKYLALFLSIVLLACTPTILPERVYETVDMTADQYTITRLDIPLYKYTNINNTSWFYSSNMLHAEAFCNLSTGFVILDTSISKVFNWNTIRINMRVEYRLGSPALITAFNSHDVNNIEMYDFRIIGISSERVIAFEVSPKQDLSIGINLIGGCTGGWNPIDLQFLRVREVWVDKVN